MIHKLELTNFKTHANLKVEFTAGLNVITGENGAGKSTILKAILYALFGASAAGSKPHLASWGVEEKMSVTLTATITGKHLVILRSFDKAIITEGDTLLASGHTPCTKYIEQELGLDYKAFKHLLYAAQGETQALLKIGAADLQRKIEVITKLDGIDKVVGLISEDLQVLSGKLSIIPVVDNLHELENDLSSLKIDEVVKIALIGRKEKMTQELKAALDEKRDYLTNVVTPAIQQAKQSKAAEAALTQSLDKVNLALQSLELNKPDSPAKLLEAEYSAVLTCCTAYKQRLHKAEQGATTIRKLEADFKVYSTHLGTLTNMQGVFVKDAELQTQLVQCTLDFARAEVAFNLSNQDNLECVTCSRPYDLASYATVSKVKAQAALAFAAVKQKLGEIKLEIIQFRQDNPLLNTISNYASELTTLSLKVDEASDSMEIARSNSGLLDADDMLELVQNIKEVDAALPKLSAIISSTMRWEQQHGSLVDQMVRLTLDLEAMEDYHCPWSDKDLADMESDVKARQLDLQTQYEALLATRYDLKELGMSKDSCRRAYEEAAKADKLRKEVEHEQAERKELQTYLRTNRARLMTDTWEGITNLTGAYTSSITGGLISELSRDVSGGFSVKEGEQTVPVEELSGGRMSIVGLALRMALGKIFYGGNSFVLLDEVSAELSETNSAAIAGFLAGLDTQILMVSHRNGDVANATNVIFLQ